MAYTYDITQLKTNKKDLMRFELGDTDVSGAEKTCVLSDEEINAMIELNSRWKVAKFKLVESVYMRFAKEVQISGDGLTIGLQARAEHWANLYAQMKKEMSGMGVPSVTTASPAYFTTGMQSNPRTDGLD